MFYSTKMNVQSQHLTETGKETCMYTKNFPVLKMIAKNKIQGYVLSMSCQLNAIKLIVSSQTIKSQTYM